MIQIYGKRSNPVTMRASALCTESGVPHTVHDTSDNSVREMAEAYTGRELDESETIILDMDGGFGEVIGFSELRQRCS